MTALRGIAAFHGDHQRLSGDIPLLGNGIRVALRSQAQPFQNDNDNKPQQHAPYVHQLPGIAKRFRTVF